MKTYVISLILLVGLIFASCNRTSPKQNAQKVESAQAQDPKKDFSELGFDLMKSESIGELKLGLNETELLENFKNPEESSKPELWGADGLIHKTLKYTTTGLKLDLIQNPDSSYAVNMITITSPCTLKTSKGIGIGSDLENVKSAYQEYINPESSDDEIIVAGTVYGGIIFKLENKKVKSIFIGASAE